MHAVDIVHKYDGLVQIRWISSTTALLNHRCIERRRGGVFLFCFVLLFFLCRECRRCFYRLVVSYKKAQENLVFLNQGLIDHETFTLSIKYESNLNFPREFLVLLDLNLSCYDECK